MESGRSRRETGGTLRFLTPALALVLAGSAFAQQAPTPPPSEEPESAPSEYSGPSILSRGAGLLLGRGDELARLRPFVQVGGLYEHDLTPVSLNSSGQIPQDSVYGGHAGFGVYGYRRWSQSLLGLNYRGSLRHYSRRAYYDGFDQVLGLNFGHQLSRRVAISVGQSVAFQNQGFGLPIAGSQFYDPGLSDLVGNELFDNRTIASVSNGRLTYQKSARLSFSLGGSGFLVRRRSQALVGVNGLQAMGDVAYRLSRFQTIGLDYSFQHFDFRHRYGSSDIHGAALNYSIQLGRPWTFGLRAGAFRAEMLGLERVPLDPVVAAIIGQGAAISTYYRVSYVPNVGANLSRRFRHAGLSFHYSRGVSAGNGIYMTTGSESYGASLRYSGIRRLGLNMSAGSYTHRALAQTLGKYSSYSANVGASYPLRRGFSLAASMQARSYEVANTSFRRLSYRASISLAYSPGEFPFAIW